ncbi:uncharacterized protein EURHEDRAFT_413383 [Aspergillus ruber CBS 135680]|uniref:Uncharacterized protein n=1 Tax=Aspergillus ruber (strain CBS 135680) TaxID=1388766 RepID=A0A017SD60_ASPRC|nr:uncharacterized protein EURHEDRAFT_413383 [Aspergillus ruber CBS 135680]EYE94160.1 hypothetical protein EURHEDRAFT_413383 [Aspergillus ruber CBS 135680]
MSRRVLRFPECIYISMSIVDFIARVSQPGFPCIVPRVLVSCILRQDTYPKCLPSIHMLNDNPGPLYITSKVSRPLQAP